MVKHVTGWIAPQPDDLSPEVLTFAEKALELKLIGRRFGGIGGWTADRVRAGQHLDQNEKRQLEGQVLGRVLTGKASGRDTTRPELAELLRFANDGDTVVVHSMDRLTRNLDDLCLGPTGVRVEFVKEHLVFTGKDSPWPTSCSP